MTTSAPRRSASATASRSTVRAGRRPLGDSPRRDVGRRDRATGAPTTPRRRRHGDRSPTRRRPTAPLDIESACSTTRSTSSWRDRATTRCSSSSRAATVTRRRRRRRRPGARHLRPASAGGEQGLLGLAFTPDRRPRLRRLHRPRRQHGHRRVRRRSPTARSTRRPDANAARDRPAVRQPQRRRPRRSDPTGCSTSAWATAARAATPSGGPSTSTTLLGKILRIDPTPSADRAYTVPPDNPFVGDDGAGGEIWSIGLRNPWRFSFDSATGDLWIADVGQNEFEEVDVRRGHRRARRRQGCRLRLERVRGQRPVQRRPVRADGATPPIYEYPHGRGGCSISGGVRARGASVPDARRLVRVRRLLHAARSGRPRPGLERRGRRHHRRARERGGDRVVGQSRARPAPTARSTSSTTTAVNTLTTRRDRQPECSHLDRT